MEVQWAEDEKLESLETKKDGWKLFADGCHATDSLDGGT